MILRHHVCACVYNYPNICEDMHVYTSICTFDSMHLYVGIYVCECTRIHIDIHTDIHTYIHTYIHKYIHTYIHTYIHMFVFMYFLFMYVCVCLVS